MRTTSLARLGLGGVCLAEPGRVVGRLGGSDRDDPLVLVATRVLGGRLVLQGLLGGVVGPRSRPLDIVVDLTHAASMVPVAWHWPEHRRTALAAAVIAAGLAGVDLWGTKA